jgi:hypothetical protein
MMKTTRRSSGEESGDMRMIYFATRCTKRHKKGITKRVS